MHFARRSFQYGSASSILIAVIDGMLLDAPDNWGTVPTSVFSSIQLDSMVGRWAFRSFELDGSEGVEVLAPTRDLPVPELYDDRIGSDALRQVAASPGVP